METFADSLFDIFADALGVPAHGVHNYLCNKYYTHVEDAGTVFELQYGENIAHISQSSKHSHMKREKTFFLSLFLELYYILSILVFIYMTFIGATSICFIKQTCIILLQV